MNNSPSLPPLREVIKKHGLTANKALGQNFLLDTQLLSRIAAVPGDLNDARVFEVGPGPGGLTQALLQAGAIVTAVERDERCLPALAELGGHFPGKLDVINEDALKIDLAELFDAPFHIVSNLPYNVGTALLLRMAEASRVPGGSALVVDRLEFSARMTEAIESHPRIRIVREEVTSIPEGPTIIATGPGLPGYIAVVLSTVSTKRSVIG